MTMTIRPASLPRGWQGAWPLVARPALIAIRDQGPLAFGDIAAVIRRKALRSDIEAAGGLVHGAEALARAVTEDAAAVLVQTDDGRWTMDSSVREFYSLYRQATMALLPPEEEESFATRPLRQWMNKGFYRAFKGRWRDGLPARRHDAKAIEAMAEVIQVLGWLPGARIVKDQDGVTIDGFKRADALGLLGIDPDTGTDPGTGEPYVEIRSFTNDAARLHYALTVNWWTLNAETRKAVNNALLGDAKTAVSPATVALLGSLGSSATVIAAVNATQVASTPPPPISEEPKPKALTDEDLDVLGMIEYAGHDGITYKEHGDAHGSISARLSRLHDAGHVVLLAKKRGGAGIYVTPDNVNGRPVAGRRRAGRSAFTNEVVATMSWAEAAPAEWNLQGRGRTTATHHLSSLAPVSEHIDAFIDEITSKAPWFLPMVCERIGQS